MDFSFCLFWIIGRDEVQQREKNDFCTLYTFSPTSLYTCIHTLSLTHTHMDTKKNSSCQKKTFIVNVRHACSQKLFLFKDF